MSGQGGVDGTRGGYGGDLMLNIGEQERIVSRMNLIMDMVHVLIFF